MSESIGTKRKSAEDPLGLMRKRSQIDARSYQAAHAFRRDHEAARPLKSKDPTAPSVKVGPRPGNPIGHLDASRRLIELRRFVGKENYQMLTLVAAHGFTLSELQDKGCGEVRYLSQRLKDALSAAANFYEGRPAPTSQFSEAAQAILRETS